MKIILLEKDSIVGYVLSLIHSIIHNTFANIYIHKRHSQQESMHCSCSRKKVKQQSDIELERILELTQMNFLNIDLVTVITVFKNIKLLKINKLE